MNNIIEYIFKEQGEIFSICLNYSTCEYEFRDNTRITTFKMKVNSKSELDQVLHQMKLDCKLLKIKY